MVNMTGLFQTENDFSLSPLVLSILPHPSPVAPLPQKKPPNPFYSSCYAQG